MFFSMRIASVAFLVLALASYVLGARLAWTLIFVVTAMVLFLASKS